MKILISLIWFILYLKLSLFWIWLWQLKEYHLARFFAHFETQKIRKFLFSFKGIKIPKITLKVVLISLSGIAIEILFLIVILNSPDLFFYVSLLISAVIVPLIVFLLVLILNIPSDILMKITMERARRKIEKFKDLIVIGITGSYGKTSAKEFLSVILSEKFNVLKTENHINAEIGIAKTILDRLKSKHQVFIAEIGAYKKGKIKQVCKMLHPKIGILTGINNQHLSTFGSLENIRKAKYELIDGLAENGIAILKDKPDLQADDIKVEKEYISFKVNSVDFKVNLLGKHNIDNVLLVASCAKKLGMSLEEISKACEKINSGQGGMKFLKKNGLTIIDSSYSANIDGVLADLEYLNIYTENKIIIMPCLIELGNTARETHREIGRKIAEVCDIAIITTKDYFKEIKEGAVSPGMKNEGVICLEKPEDIIKKVKTIGDCVILLEGRVPKQLAIDI